MADIAPKLVGLSAEKLTALHKRVHDQYLSSATIEVHHTILNEMGRRGMELPQDDWNEYEILVDSIDEVDLTQLSGLPAEAVLEVIKSTGNTVGNIKTFLTVKGYQMRVEPVNKMIAQEDGKWVVYNEEGTRKFGSYDSKEEAEARLRQIHAFSKADDTYSPPSAVRSAAKRAIGWIDEGFAGQGFTATGRTRAGQLARGEAVSIQTLKRMKSFFSRHEVDKRAKGFNRGEEGFPSAGRVAWDAWGGDAGFAWAESMVERYENAQKIEKHGEHDQSTHGAWAQGGAGTTTRERRVRSGNVPDIKRDADGKIPNPDATGGYKKGVPENLVMRGGKFVQLDESAGEQMRPGDTKITPENSLWHHLEPDGQGGFQFTEERRLLHSQIISDTVANVPESTNPTFFMLGGGPASGKTSAIREGVVDVPSADSRKAVYINADDVKEKLPENTRMRNGDDQDFFHAASFSHEESSILAKAIQAVAIRNGQDIVLDGTGDSAISKLGGKVEEARNKGYRVEGHYVTIPTETAVERSNERSLGPSNRYVPNHTVRETHAQVSGTFRQAIAADLFDSVKLYDNSGDKPRVIVTKVQGGNLEVLDKNAYDAFLAKENEGKKGA